MVIDIKGTSISIPNHISDWVKENEDNRTEFFGMLDSIMYAVKTFYKNQFKPNPYQDLYEEQLKSFERLGCSRKDAEIAIKNYIDEVAMPKIMSNPSLF